MLTDHFTAARKRPEAALRPGAKSLTHTLLWSAFASRSESRKPERPQSCPDGHRPVLRFADPRSTGMFVIVPLSGADRNRMAPVCQSVFLEVFMPGIEQKITLPRHDHTGNAQDIRGRGWSPNHSSGFHVCWTLASSPILWRLGQLILRN